MSIGKRTLLLPFLLVLVGAFASAQTNPSPTPHATQVYSLGDQMVYIDGGLFIPLFFMDEGGNHYPTNLSLGGDASIGWNAFLSNNFSLGAELGGTFSFSPNNRSLIMIPLTGKVTYWLRFYPFEFPIYLGAGINFMKLSNYLYFGPILKPGFGAYYDITSKWSAGVDLVYWWVPEIYFGPNPPASQSRFGNFLQISAAIGFHF